MDQLDIFSLLSAAPLAQGEDAPLAEISEDDLFLGNDHLSAIAALWSDPEALEDTLEDMRLELRAASTYGEAATDLKRAIREVRARITALGPLAMH